MKLNLRPPMDLVLDTEDSSIWMTRSSHDPNRQHVTILSRSGAGVMRDSESVHWEEFTGIASDNVWYITCTCIGWCTHHKCWHVKDAKAGM